MVFAGSGRHALDVVLVLKNWIIKILRLFCGKSKRKNAVPAMPQILVEQTVILEDCVRRLRPQGCFQHDMIIVHQ
jgi:hypothetical protein